MKQSYLNAGLTISSLIVLTFVVSAILGTSSFTILAFAGNLLVYLFFFVGFQVILPILTGYLTRKYGMTWLDDKFGSNYRDRIPGWLHILIAVVLGLVVGLAWMKLTPLIAFIPSLSVWPPVEFFRWTASKELINYSVVIWPAISFAVSYLFTHSDISD